LLGTNCQQTNVLSADNSGLCSWPNPGSDEIDVTEILGSDSSHVNQQVHTVTSNDGCSAATVDVTQGFHLYTLEWSPGRLVWSIDGTPTCTVTNGVPSTPMFLMMNVAVAGAGGAPNAADFPQAMQVDSVKVSQ
jgi:beta-glucanase (GH16 family)